MIERRMQYPTFRKKFNIVPSPEGNEIHETYGADYEIAVPYAMTDQLWTVIQGEGGRLYLVAGWHYVNRVGYVVTQESYTDHFTVPWS